MRNEEACQRYAKALFELASANKSVDSVLNEVREFTSAVQKDAELSSFFMSPLNLAGAQKASLEKFFEKKPFTDEVKGLLMLLAEKRRFSLLVGIAHAFQDVVDQSRGVARGHVYSAATLFPEERQKLEATISRYTGKKAVLEYHEDKSLLGGMIARVGSYTFDDSLETQLRLMKEALMKRRAN